MPVKAVHEIFKEVEDTKGEGERIELLRRYCQRWPALVRYLWYVYSPRVKVLLPDTEIDPKAYKLNEFDERGNFFQEIRRFGIFTDERPEISQWKREKLFVEVLEFIHRDDVPYLYALIHRRLPNKGLTSKFIMEKALPEVEW